MKSKRLQNTLKRIFFDLDNHIPEWDYAIETEFWELEERALDVVNELQGYIPLKMSSTVSGRISSKAPRKTGTKRRKKRLYSKKNVKAVSRKVLKGMTVTNYTRPGVYC